MSQPVTFDLSRLPPSTNNLFVTAGSRRIRSPLYKEWANASGWEIKSQVKGGGVQGPFALTAWFVRPDNRKRDIDNLTKALLDLCKSVGVIADDSEAQEVSLKWTSAGPPCRVQIIPCRRQGQEDIAHG